MVELALVVLLIAVAKSHGTFFNCLEVNVETHLNSAKLTGLWYVYAKTTLITEIMWKCEKVEINLIGKGRVHVKRSHITKFWETESSRDYEVVKSSPGVFEAEGHGLLSKPHTVSVLGTDNSTFLVGHICTGIPFVNDLIFILTRERRPSHDIVIKAYDVLVVNNIALNKVEQTIQNACF